MRGEAQTMLKRVRSTRDRTLALVDSLSQADMDTSPAPGAWSVGEVLDHLILSDRLYYHEVSALFALKQTGQSPYLRRSFSDIDATILFFPKSWLLYMETPMRFINLFLPRTLRTFFIKSRLVPAQTPERSRPHPGRSKEALCRELTAGPDTLQTIFVQQPDIDYREFKHYHPLLGENNLSEILQFLTNHETVHQKQILDIIATINRSH